MPVETLPNGTAVHTDVDVRFGADALLLARFAAPRSGRLLDLGCGCGILALAALDEGFTGTITALDIDPGACALARQGAAPFADTVQVLQADLRAHRESQKFDVVLCNPPYFRPGSGRPGTGEYARRARHQTDCTLDDIAAAAARNLKQGGRLALCYPPDGLAELFAVLRGCRLEPKRLQLVRHADDGPPWLALAEARMDGGTGLDILPDILT